jgi:p-hydroxybenzoate 3-monooxygenase
VELVSGDTPVAIIGAGPAGLVLAHLLAARGIDSVVLELHDRDYVERRVRAGVLEYPTVALLRYLGVADRLDREGLAHRGIELAFEGRRHRLDFNELVGHSITVYGQQEIVKDLIAARLGAGGPIVFEATDVTIDDIDSDSPVVRYLAEGSRHELRCRIVAGCDGFHGVSRDVLAAVDAGHRMYERDYPFAWLGILAEAAPTIDELIYSGHDNGFALYSMRSPKITRLYLQVPADERIEDWSDDRIWSELETRLPTGDGFSFNTGPILERGISAMRSFVSTPMRHGSLVIAGDAAHIVPATGAKGMNLAIADVAVLADILEDVISRGRDHRLAEYTDACLRRVWRCQHFSWWMTSMLHRFDDDPFRRQLQLSELRLVTSSTAAATSLAENYVGLALGESFLRSVA